MDKIINKLKPYYPNIIEVSYENIKDISFDNIVAFTYASPGAQGDNGAVTIVHKTTSVVFYHINRLVTEDENLLRIVDKLYFNKLSNIMLLKIKYPIKISTINIKIKPILVK